MEQKHLIPKNRVGKLFLEAFVFGISLTWAPPMGIALFAPNAKTSVKVLEEQFQNLKDKDGK